MLPLSVSALDLRGQVKPRFYINLEGTPLKEIYMPGDSKTCIEYHPQNEQSISFEDIVGITPNNRISSDPKTRIFMSGANEDYGLQFMDLRVKLGEKNFEINEYARASVINGVAVSLNEATHRSSGKYYLLKTRGFYSNGTMIYYHFPNLRLHSNSSRQMEVSQSSMINLKLTVEKPIFVI